MATGNFSDEQLAQPTADRAVPQIGLFTMFRLGLFQMGLGLLSLLTLGVLNQVLISELRIPGTIAAGAIAMYQFVAPARIWFGYMSDSRPILGHHRTGYIWLGLALQAVCLYLAVQVVWQLGASTVAGWTAQSTGWAALLAFMFALYGLCISSSSTPFTALLVDVSEEENRSKLVGIVWAMLIVGIVAGAIAGEKMLEGITPETLQPSINRLFTIFPIAVVGLGVLATFGIEKKYSHYQSRSTIAEREDRITLGAALKVLTASRQTAIFFTFLMVMTISLFLQQPVLEPYAREVFGMTLGESAGLNQFWGYGILAGMAISGFVIVPRLGKQRTAQLGCLFTAGCFVLVILSGLTETQVMLKSAVMLFGLASGILTNGAVSLMLDLTAAETAGTFVGAWGLSQALSQATATVAGGALLDLGRNLFQSPLPAFSLVFACQAIGMLVAVWLLSRVDVQEFRTKASKAIAAVLQTDLD
ncbi:BCD family MFS transporter [Leptolyngbya sp. FACHB-671]|uniref:BCD family MFS transporter n=1 Tax=Leptolyngbya sp. FACHB-671 TaxID=2692812 RepID=UPI001687B29A|nr:BCD family MFS transporter [Leptolyngbya sp. FACHB-671]MBD2067548.1 BCD family MFS transporter [Leptolyngbya sp. FACHB-671]